MMPLMSYTAPELADMHFTGPAIGCMEKHTWPSIDVLSVKGRVMSV